MFFDGFWKLLNEEISLLRKYKYLCAFGCFARRRQGPTGGWVTPRTKWPKANTLMNDNLIKIYDFCGRAADLLELFKDEPHVFLLETAISNQSTGRFSFLGFDPFEIFEGGGKSCLGDLKKKFLRYKDLSPSNGFTPLASGIVGYLSYDLGLSLENIPCRPQEGSGIPDCFFGFYDCVLTVDHVLKKLIVSSSGLPEKNPFLREKRARERLEYVGKKILQGFDQSKKALLRNANLRHDKNCQSNFTKQEYLRAVRKILEHIRRGDVYQVNLSQRFELPAPAGILPADLYKRLSGLSAVNFGGYFDCKDFQIISNSPERFIKLEKNRVSTRPMKGTRSRGATAVEDRQKRKELLTSAKDKAELLMITDLERNDLGRVCQYGTVKVKQMRTIENYQTVFQATSSVEGILKKDRDAFDVLRACFPGGSVTGCPKIRAMQIIDALEPTRRGIYTGALGYMNFSGDMDFNVLIRTLIRTPKRIYFQTGGGIVADSIPEDEYEETLIKAKALRLALSSVILREADLKNIF